MTSIVPTFQIRNNYVALLFFLCSYMRPNMLAFLADLFNLLEIRPVNQSSSSSLSQTFGEHDTLERAESSNEFYSDILTLFYIPFFFFLILQNSTLMPIGLLHIWIIFLSMVFFARISAFFNSLSPYFQYSEQIWLLSYTLCLILRHLSWIQPVILLL